MKYTIDNTECRFCGLCVKECPPRAISICEEKQTAEIDAEGCIECSHCAMVCPYNAVRADGLKLDEYPETAVSAAGVPDFTEGFMHTINSKRSVRYYKKEIPSEKELAQIIKAGRLTATATNSQEVRAVILKGAEVADASKIVAGVFLKVVRLGNTPPGRTLLRIIGLKGYARKDLLEAHLTALRATIEGKKDIFFFKAPAVVILTYPARSRRFGRTDCALAGQNMMLTAHAMGIGSCMIGFAEAALLTKGLRKKVGVPENRRIGLVFTLGYQIQKYRRYPLRADWKIQNT